MTTTSWSRPVSGLRDKPLRLLCVVVTHNRPQYSIKTINSWLDHRYPFDELRIVDNASTEGMEWLPSWTIRNERNLFPGAATNIGWHAGIAEFGEFDLLMRSDNDIQYLPGWREEVEQAFQCHPTLGQLGILNMHEDFGGNQPVTAWEENGHTLNVDQFTGGNCVIRRELWDQGLRWQSGPWRPGPNEDTQMTLDVQKAGWRCARVIPTVANNLSYHQFDAYPAYYTETARLRGLVPELSV